MRCTYCDTAYAFHGGEKRSIENILEDVAQYNARYITVTGGEPLAQPECHDLLVALCNEGYEVSLETGGAIDISKVDNRVCIVLDVKTPDSNEEKNNTYENLDYIKKTDLLKFVICSQQDYEWSKKKVERLKLADKCEVLFSPSADQLPAVQLADWIVADRLPVRMQIQLHKYLWGNQQGV